MSEAECILVSSRGILKSCDVFPANPQSDTGAFNWNSLKIQISKCDKHCPRVYVCTSVLPYFIQHLGDLPKPIILVSGDSDVACSSIDYMKIIDSPRIIHWFAQNCNLPVRFSHRVTAIPIGLDFHTLASSENHAWGDTQTPRQQDTVLRCIEKTPLAKRKPICYSTFQFSRKARYGAHRDRAIERLNPATTYYEPSPVGRIVSWINQLNYAFVISPPGNGLDCHRTWEALALGCIPIVLRTNRVHALNGEETLLDQLYKKASALIVDDYSEVTPFLLEKTIAERIFNTKILELSFWVKMSPSEPMACAVPYEITRPSAVVGLCVFNCRFGIPRVIRNILAMTKLFNITVVAYYNTSDHHPEDGLTDLYYLSYLHNIGKGCKVIVLNGGTPDRTLARTERIAKARNGILSWIRSSAEPEYVIMMDANEYSCVGAIDIDVLQTALENKTYKWDMLSFNREAGYYDIWALSYEPYVYSFFHFENWRKAVQAMRDDFGPLLEKHRTDDTWMPVLSAFNGFAIYKANVALDSEYDTHIVPSLFPAGLIEKECDLLGQRTVQPNVADCEHRGFHLRAINKGAKMYICPKYLFKKYTEAVPLPENCRGPA